MAVSVSAPLLVILAAIILIAPNVYASSGSSKTAGSISDILNPAATDATGTTLFDAHAQALIAHCNLTNAEYDANNSTSIMLSPHDIQVNHWPSLKLATYVCIVDISRPIPYTNIR